MWNFTHVPRRPCWQNLPLNFQACCKVWLITSSWGLVTKKPKSFKAFSLLLFDFCLFQVWRHMLFRHPSIQFPCALQQSGLICASGSCLALGVTIQSSTKLIVAYPFGTPGNVKISSTYLKANDLSWVINYLCPLLCDLHLSLHCTATSDDSNNIGGKPPEKPTCNMYYINLRISSQNQQNFAVYWLICENAEEGGDCGFCGPLPSWPDKWVL